VKLATFREKHRGPVITPEDRGYDLARATYNGMIDNRPAVVARALDADDVVCAVGYAREAELPISVRGGGHSVAGHCIGEGSLVVDLRLMRFAEIDVDARKVTCGGGALWEDVDTACQRAGLATPGGTFGDTGIGGLTLGGGMGHLSPAYGLTLDNLLSATVVTAEGAVVPTSEEENPELFWALRGGGGNFGVVVDFAYRLYPVGLLLGGHLNFQLDDAEEVLTTWRELMAGAPDELASFAQIFRDLVTGEGIVNTSVAWLDGEAAGRDVISPLTDLGPVQNTVRPMYYPELQELYGRGVFGLRNYWSGRFVRELPDELIGSTAEQFVEDRLTGGVLIEPMHGAPARVPGDATAFAGREARWNVTFLSAWTDPTDDEHEIAKARAYSQGLAPWAHGGGYLNYASEAAADDGLETEFGAERLSRLRAVKRRFDPDNIFRFNHNIAP
jgi:FAD/FMN-containing dehydrogenase